MLTIENFSKRYGDTLVLTVRHLELAPGVYWIKGENGSGKTTFFRSLSGLLPCEGKLSFDDGVTLHHHPLEYRRRVNYSEAEPLYPEFLTAKELTRFIGKTKGASLQQQDDVTRAFGIDQFFEKPCGACSSGMMKKISLALAFLGTPRIIILDEPLITLDEASRHVLTNLIQTFRDQFNVTFLLSSHQLLESSSLVLNDVLHVRDKTLARA
ncbi:ABC transporter ATP-binding protein [Chryseolinea lacunae]|uniref:ABC transporter ATP-binding protein n=1 Tax=Chryseolinea lacunae TaxID=2801331 RepID=A0ABS1KLA0_9BACT|nr:ABC transporter ATP-binding protein [Chryseolinea lacunae]MBL0740120.1 ABC transporter ATP-binding protein [Chryseolinea lacunae]